MSDERRRELARLAGDGDEASAVALLVMLRREHDTGILDTLGRCYACKDSGWVAIQPYFPPSNEDPRVSGGLIDATTMKVARCPYCETGLSLGEAPAPATPKAIFRTMTDLEAKAAIALGNASFAPGTSDKRMARTIFSQVPTRRITDKQAAVMWRLVYRYRRSIQDAELVEIGRQRSGQDFKA